MKCTHSLTHSPTLVCNVRNEIKHINIQNDGKKKKKKRTDNKNAEKIDTSCCRRL